MASPRVVKSGKKLKLKLIKRTKALENEVKEGEKKLDEQQRLAVPQ